MSQCSTNCSLTTWLKTKNPPLPLPKRKTGVKSCLRCLCKWKKTRAKEKYIAFYLGLRGHSEELVQEIRRKLRIRTITGLWHHRWFAEAGGIRLLWGNRMIDIAYCCLLNQIYTKYLHSYNGAEPQRYIQNTMDGRSWLLDGRILSSIFN